MRELLGKGARVFVTYDSPGSRRLISASESVVVGRWTARLHVKTEVRIWPGWGGATAPRDLYLGRCGSCVVDRCSSSVRCSCSAAASHALRGGNQPSGAGGIVTKTRAPFPNNSRIGQPLPVGAERHGQADKTFIGVCVCARRIADASVGPGLHAQKQARGERSVELTRGAGTRSAPAAPPST